MGVGGLKRRRWDDVRGGGRLIDRGPAEARDREPMHDGAGTPVERIDCLLILLVFRPGFFLAPWRGGLDRPPPPTPHHRGSEPSPGGVSADPSQKKGSTLLNAFPNILRLGRTTTNQRYRPPRPRRSEYKKQPASNATKNRR